jgi:CheY-like chemotaxis protein
MHLLLVEDDEINREVALEILNDSGSNVDVAVDGVDAVEKSHQCAYDLILMDMQMPRMDGLAATGEIRKLPAHRSTPILAMTANAFEEDRKRCLAAGMNDFIAKPFQPQQLIQAIVNGLHCLEVENRRP